MQEDQLPQACFRCTADFRSLFMGTAKSKGTSGQYLLQKFAERWLKEALGLAEMPDAKSFESEGSRERRIADGGGDAS